MRKVMLRGIVAARGRIVLTVLTVLLGTAFISASGTAGATLNASFSAGDESDYPDVTVAAEPESVFESIPRPLGDEVASQVDGLDGVAGIDPVVTPSVVLSTADGTQLTDTGGGAVSFQYGAAVWPTSSAAQAPALAAGEAPQQTGDVVLYQAFAEDAGVAVGDTVVVSSLATAVEARVVGLAQADDGSEITAPTPFVTYEDAQALAGRPGAERLNVAAEEGVTNDELADRVSQALGPDVEITTAADALADAESANASSTTITQAVLGGFGAVALVVGSFLVGNTVNMIVAQRQRQLALLRALGATRRQVRRAVIGEAAIITGASAVAGALVGIGVGYLLVRVLAGTSDAFPDVSLQVSPLFLVLAVLAGPLVGVVAASAAARRATSIPPVAALSDVGVADVRTRPSRGRVIAGLVVLGLAVVVMAGAVASGAEQAAAAAAGGGVLALVALIVLNPVVARVVAPATTRLLPGSRGAVARLARTNTRRDPRRVAGTASALLIGLTVVVTAMVLASSIGASLGGALERALTETDLVVDEGVAGVPETTLETVAALPEVELAGADRTASVEYGGELVTVSGVTSGIDEFLDVGGTTGTTPGALAAGQVAVAEGAAETFDLGVGDRVEVSFPDGTSAEWSVAGTYESEAVLNGFTVPADAVADTGNPPGWTSVYVRLADGTAVDAGIDAIDAALAGGQGAPRTAADVVEEGQAGLTLVLNIILGLLAVTLIVALLGVVNTTVLATLERTREFGLLRAIGTTRPQLRDAVRRETVAVTLYGALTGVVAGLVVGSAIVLALRGYDIEVLSVPWWRIAVVIVVALVAGVLAAALPARRAARMDVLDALRTA